MKATPQATGTRAGGAGFDVTSGAVGRWVIQRFEIEVYVFRCEKVKRIMYHVSLCLLFAVLTYLCVCGFNIQVLQFTQPAGL